MLAFLCFRLEAGQDYTYIDVFHGGQFLTEFECSNLLDIPVDHTVMRSNCETASPMKVSERVVLIERHWKVSEKPFILVTILLRYYLTGGQIGRAWVSRGGYRGFEPLVESNQ